jgi:uncharacterized protein (DUF488 family)
MPQRTLFTIGHSTRTWQEFIDLLHAWKIEELVDVRSIPGSRAFPWFAQNKMKIALPNAGIRYTHLPDLGGRRHSRKNSPNTGWRNASFRSYADYMQTPEFRDGLQQLNAIRKKHRTCIMCAEAVWWRCHRRMIADAELAQKIPVRHIMTPTSATPHTLTPFAQIQKPRAKPPTILYPQQNP